MVNEVIRQIMAHRSIRKFDYNFEIPRDHIDLIIKAGQRASTSSMLQMYTIIEIPKAERQSEVTICGSQQFIKDASYFGIIFTDFYRLKRLTEVSEGTYDENYPSLELTMGILDAGLIAQNMALASESLGYGMVYCGACGDFGDQIIEKLEIPEKVLPLTGIAIGKRIESPKLSPRLPSSLIHHIGKYKQYSDNELQQGIQIINEGLSEKAGTTVNWADILKARYEGSWAPIRNGKRKKIILQQFGTD